jgi:putative flippase GtrA
MRPPRTPAELALRYLLFAAIAVAANLGSQALVFGLASTGALAFVAALVIGTGVGLVVKYVLDARWIFYVPRSRSQESKTFLGYAGTGLVTTGIFWGAEIGFHFGFPDWAEARYVGGALGLAVGYVVKYRLDRRYVFAPVRQD